MGLIPAHAGKTRSGAWSRAGRRAHPRSRGENRPSPSTSKSWAGSSPLTRGKLRGPRPRDTDRGLIPAHAGKTDLGGGGGHERGAHPRSRGENGVESHTIAHGLGSSPLTRGKHAGGHAAAVGPGLIPAHAGKTSATPTATKHYRAHPRSRGENTPWSPARAPCLGSSPLTRGKRHGGGPNLCGRGLIPAHAGKTQSRRPRY